MAFLLVGAAGLGGRLVETYWRREAMHEGRRATVYRAIRQSDNRPVAIKVLHPEHCRPQDLDRLAREHALGRSLAGLSSVLAPLALTTVEGSPALEFEDFAGVPLERLVGAPMAVDAFLHFAARLAAAVADLHDRGIIHKDLKPSNILYAAERNELKIVGFGVASRVGREQTTPRPTHLIEGSLPYVSPEQTGRMNRAIDSRSDLYSLGIIFYELLTGRLPFSASDPIGWIHGHLAHKPAPPVLLRPELPPVLSDIVLKLLAKVPDDRYQTAAGLARDLERCLRQARESPSIVPFRLGEHDLSDRFLIPQKLYGRAAECAALAAAFERVAQSGTPELVLVSGYSGIGKSAVVQELHRPIVGRRGLFIAGKFEQYKRDIPYLTVIQAFRELALDILAESEGQIAAWRQRISAALGRNGQLIVDLIPPVGLIIGPQPPVPELPLTEAEARLSLVLRQFFGAFTDEQHPLVLFLDDLQWADAASLKLMADLMGSDGARYLMLIGAYRDNEVDRAHPLLRTLAEVRQGGAAVRDIVLQPLSEADIAQLLADTVHCSPAEAAPLGRLVREKTGGNPFFAIHFLTALYRQGLLTFDHARTRWCWDVARIAAERYTDNVADLMIGKLRQLPTLTQEALRLVAALGITVDADTLAIVLERDVEPALRVAIEQDLLLRIDRAYRFPHDRVQEAAYALTPPEERTALHLRIGRLLLARTPADAIDEHVFEIVHHLNRGAARLESPAERERLAELNLVAARRAQHATAYSSAVTYLAAGAALLPESAWVDRYELRFALELHRAECESLTAEHGQAEPRLAQLARRARGVVDAAAVACARLALYIGLNQLERAVEISLEFLRGVGIDWSPHCTDEQVRQEYDRIWQRLGDRPIEALVDLPAMTDPEWRAIIDVLSLAHVPATTTDDNLNYLLMARVVNISLDHGNSDGSCYGYLWVGNYVGARFGDYRLGYRIAKVGFDLVERRGLFRFQGRVYLCFGYQIGFWNRPVRVGLELLRRAFVVAQEAGDLTFASFACNTSISLLLVAGVPLGDVLREAEQALAFMHKNKLAFVSGFITIQRQLIRTLAGQLPRFGSFDDEAFDEVRFEQELERQPGPKVTTCWYWIRKLQARFFANDLPSAVAAAAQAEPLTWTCRGYAEIAELRFYSALALAAYQADAPAHERPRHRAALEAHLQTLEAWAENCPETFANRAALVGAELARLDGHTDKAMALYERAIESARQGGFVNHEALAYETASRFYRARGLRLIADTYLREARDRYRSWGAEGKVRQLEQLHPQLAKQRPLAQAATLSLQPEQLDLLAVLKASQALSSVIIRDQLLQTLLQVVLEGSGARRAWLILVRGGELALAAAGGADEAPPLPGADWTTRVPMSILHYVLRTQEPVLLSDASGDVGRFASDPYLVRARAGSILCWPIRRQGAVVALLYLDNDLIPGTFTPERLVALELLAAQTAISLENVQLLEHEHARRVEAEAARGRALLLGEATALISSTLDDEGVFATLARLCTRSFADWAVIDLCVGDRNVRLAGAHRDPDKEPLLRELAERYPARPGSGAPAGAVLASGAPLHMPDIDDATQAATSVDERHAELIRALGTRSAVIVPLVIRETRLGALTLSSATPNRFSPADVDLAIEIGRRAALAIDNARLFHETQRALHLRDEFLAVASHELRTPLTSLRLTVESLLQIAGGEQTVPGELLGKSLQRVLRKSDRLRQLVAELLDVTRIEQGRLETHPTEVDLAALVRDVVERFESELLASRCTVSIAGEGPVMGAWDASRLDQVITNLLSNAIKFGPGQPIEVQVGQVGAVARLTVADRGIGIDPARLPFVFDRFERAVSSSHYGGLGLGLYIARSIVQAHGGSIQVQSVLGGGSTFTVELPCQPTRVPSRP